MKKLIFLLLILIYPQTIFAQTFEINKNQTLIKCDDNFSIEIPENTFSEKTFVDCRKADKKEIQNIKLSNESIGSIYHIIFKDELGKEINFFRNELKINYKDNGVDYSKEISMYIYDKDYNNWIVISSEKSDNNLSAKMFLSGYVAVFQKGADNNSIDVYTTVFFNIIVLIFIISSFYIFFAIINKKTI